jgi:uncharacterized lipoprotein YmbA
MRAAGSAICLALSALLTSCAGQADHFYVLRALPDGSRAAAPTFGTHVILGISLPAVVDRREMVINASGDRLLVLEHERWAAPMSELVAATLARDIEQRRADVLVADRGFDRSGAPAVNVRVDVVRMSAVRGGGAALEAHWRILDPAAKTDQIGGGSFTAPLEAGDYAAVARAFSECLSALADRLVQSIPASSAPAP